MEVHRFEKAWIAVSLLLIVGWIATVTYGAVGPGIAMVNDEGGQVDPTNLDGTAFANPGGQWNGDEYEVYVVAQQFYFVPGTNRPIRVPVDTRVTFYLTSPDVIHGFEVVGTNLNTMVIPGQVTALTTRFDETGEYGIVCNEYCGAGHHTMAGNIRVVPRTRLNATEA